MKKADVPVLLAALSQFQYVQADEMAVEMWHSSLDEDMTVAFAADAVARWYAEDSSKTVLPGNINREWRGYKARQRQLTVMNGLPTERGRHCERAECTCAHSEPCFKGWLDSDDATVVSPCRRCRPELADVLATIPPLHERTTEDMARVRARSKHYAGQR